MYLHQSTWPEIENYLKRHRGILIPIGSTEQHGPTGLLGTDILCPEIIAGEAADRAPQRDAILIGPSFNVGIAAHHMGFSGSMTIRPSTMIAALTDWVNSLVAHGFERIYFLNGHGGNVPTVKAAFSEIYAQSGFQSRRDNTKGIACHLQNWWELDGVVNLCKELFPKGHGSHATPSEISVTWHGDPAQMRDVAVSPKIAPNGPIRDAADYRRRFPDGRIGSDVSLASAEHGSTLVDKAAHSLIKSYRAFLAS